MKTNGLSRRELLSLAGAAALGLFPSSAEAGVAPHKPGKRRKPGKKPSLYDRLGGYFGIAAVVNRFSDEIITNPVLNVNPALRAWNETEAEARLPGLKFGRTLWIAAVAGGPFKYTGLPLTEAHAEFNLTADEFAEVGAEIVRALDERGIATRGGDLASLPLLKRFGLADAARASCYL